jgi:ATP phosphoribosyltransferase regulatory subunit
METRNWRLPAGVNELLPPDAWCLELLRRTVLDVFARWGYEYIDPPIVEYLDALLVGGGDDLDLQTLKTVDQRSGRLLGVRADMTAQAVRVDAHSRPVASVQRLCYAGNVVFANPVSPLDARVPLKAGAELFGTASLRADAEVIGLMLEVLDAVGITDPIVVLGHMGIYRSLVEGLGLHRVQESALFDAVQSKAETDIARLVGERPEQTALVRLPSLMGERDVLAKARAHLAKSGAKVAAAIDQLEALADQVIEQSPGVRLRFDLAELVGYGYHNGPVFSAYHADVGRAVARGGRYDGVGDAFGRGRPATGFDVILNELVTGTLDDRAVWVPWAVVENDGDGAFESIRALRSGGDTVVVALSAEDECPPRCDRVLERADGTWVVTALDDSVS